MTLRESIMLNLEAKAYIFDMDGTLLDSMHVWENVDLGFLLKRGIAVPPDYVEVISSMSFTETAAYTIERFGLPDSVESLIREWNELTIYAYGHTVEMKPGAKEYLHKLRSRGAKLAVATGLPAELYEPALHNHGIYDFFHAICGADEVRYGKSRPDIFLLTAKKLGVQPSDCLVFEDILQAVKSAKSAGMAVCGVFDKASEKDWEEIKKEADYVIRSFREIV